MEVWVKRRIWSTVNSRSFSCRARSQGRKANLGPFSVKESTFKEFSGALLKQFGEKVFSKYQSFRPEGLGPILKVETEEAYEDMVDYIAEDAESDNSVHNGSLDLSLYPVPGLKEVSPEPGLKEVKLVFTNVNPQVTVTLDFEIPWEDALVREGVRVCM